MVFDFTVEDISASSHPTFSLFATFSQQDESSAFLQAASKEQTLSMPPKSVYHGGGQALLSHFAAWFDEAYFVQMLLNGYQREQVHFDGLWTFTTAAFLDALFPFRDQTFYPLPELVLFQRFLLQQYLQGQRLCRLFRSIATLCFTSQFRKGCIRGFCKLLDQHGRCRLRCLIFLGLVTF